MNKSLAKRQKRKTPSTKEFDSLWVVFWTLVVALCVQFAIGLDFKYLIGEICALLVMGIDSIISGFKTGKNGYTEKDLFAVKPIIVGSIAVAVILFVLLLSRTISRGNVLSSHVIIRTCGVSIGLSLLVLVVLLGLMNLYKNFHR